jgi:50S ribosomal subunit-associated GTPase HflX
VDEIKTLCKETQADGVIFLNPLNSSQINNVESEMGCWVKVWKVKKGDATNFEDFK